MTLGTHIVVGTALASVYAGGPVAAFGIGLISHYLLDSIPHWDYPISSNNEKNVKAFTTDVTKVFTDVLIGVGIMAFILSPERIFTDPVIIAAIIGSAFPDFLQFGLIVYKHEVLNKLQRFHHSFHSHLSLNDKPLKGIIYQVLIIVFFVLALQ